MLRLLLVDDEPEIREALADYLEQSGFFVATAATASEALINAREFAPGGLLTDLSLPDLEAFQFLQQFKEQFPTCQIFLHSGRDLDEIQGLLDELGLAQAPVFLKPCDLQEMALTIKAKLGGELL